jgi:phage terminase large subunit
METASEFVKYSYKVDRVTGDILPMIIDAHNHYIDALRYALQPMIKQKGKPRMAKVIGA